MPLHVSNGLTQVLDSPWEGGNRTGNCHNPEKNEAMDSKKRFCPFHTCTHTRGFFYFVGSKREYFSSQKRKPLPKGKKNKVATTTNVRYVSKSLTGWSKTKTGNFDLNPRPKARGWHLSSLSALQTTSQRMGISLFLGLILVPSTTVCAWKNKQFVFSLSFLPVPMCLMPSTS